MTKRTLILLFLLSLFLGNWAWAAGGSQVKSEFSFDSIKGKAETVLLKYSGKEIAWNGTLKQLVSNEAYFDYLLELPSGDRIHVLSDRGIPFKPGEKLHVKGFIMIKEGRFSHIVLNEAKKYEAPLPRYVAGGGQSLLSLDISDKACYQRILNWISYYNPGISQSSAQFIARAIIKYSKKYRVDPFLVTALFSAESAFNMQAVSVAGAIGLGQLMPGTASTLGVNPYNPEENIAGSVRYLRGMLDLWGKTKDPVGLALASYNAGPGAVQKYGGIPPYRETVDYVIVVSAFYQQIRSRTK